MDSSAVCWLARVGEAIAEVEFPEIDVPTDEFRVFVEARRDQTSIEQLALHAGELYLTCACVRGDPVAIALFDRRYLSEIDRILSPAQLAGQRDDLIQAVREKLFVGGKGAVPKIEQYRGAGALRRWVRLVIARTFLDTDTRARRMLAADTQSVATDLMNDGGRYSTPETGDVELDYFKRLYRSEFSAAFSEAARTLERSERGLLFHHYVERMTLDALASEQGVHRVTVARRIARVREHLRDAVLARLRSHLAVDTESIDSILRMLESQPPVELLGLLEPTELTISPEC